jgi:hypothetical protein
LLRSGALFTGGDPMPGAVVEGLSEALHAELSPIGVRVTVVEHRLLPNRLP